MKISPVSFQLSFQKKRNIPANAMPKGVVQTEALHAEREEDVRDRFVLRDLPHHYTQSLLQGDVPLKRLNGTYEPDIVLVGDVYYAAGDEYIQNSATKGRSAVVYSKDKVLTPSRMKYISHDTLESLLSMEDTLEKEIEYYKEKCHSLGLKIPRTGEKNLFENGAENEYPQAPQGEYYNPACDNNDQFREYGDENDPMAAYNRLKDLMKMKFVVSLKIDKVLAALKRSNIDYWQRNGYSD